MSSFKKHKFKLPKGGLTQFEKDKLIAEAAKKYAEYMDVLLPGWEDDPNSKGTPMRVAKAFVEDIGKGLYSTDPNITAFENIEKYAGLVLQSNIPVKSLCAHHHQHIFGIAHVAYIPSENGKIIGLSKLNRIVENFSRTPQIQENLTQQIHDCINEICIDNKGVAVVIKAKHNCVGHRGVNHDSDMLTSVLSGGFHNEQKVREEFYRLIDISSK